jgi:hypothetical protein
MPGVLTIEPLPERDHDGLGQRLGGTLLHWPWTGFPGNTLWDWL